MRLPVFPFLVLGLACLSPAWCIAIDAQDDTLTPAESETLTWIAKDAPLPEFPEYAKGLSEAVKGLAAHPENERFLAAKIRCLVRLRQWQELEALLNDKAFQKHSELREAVASLCLIHEGAPDQADVRMLALLEKVADDADTLETVRVALGAYSSKASRWIWDRAIDRERRNLDNHFVRAWVLAEGPTNSRYEADLAVLKGGLSAEALDEIKEAHLDYLLRWDRNVAEKRAAYLHDEYVTANRLWSVDLEDVQRRTRALLSLHEWCALAVTVSPDEVLKETNEVLERLKGKPDDFVFIPEMWRFVALLRSGRIVAERLRLPVFGDHFITESAVPLHAALEEEARLDWLMSQGDFTGARRALEEQMKTSVDVGRPHQGMHKLIVWKACRLLEQADAPFFKEHVGDFEGGWERTCGSFMLGKMELEAFMKEALDIPGRASEAWFLAGCVRFAQDELDEAQDCFQKSVDSVNMAYAHREWARAGLRLVAGEKAKKPKTAEAWIEKAHALLAGNTNDAAISEAWKCFDEAVALEPANPKAYIERARAHSGNDEERAEADLTKAIELLGTKVTIDVFLQRAETRHALGRDDDARKDLEKVLALFPDNTEAKDLLARLGEK